MLKYLNFFFNLLPLIFLDNLSYLLKLFCFRKELFNFSSFSLGLKFLDLFFDNLKNCCLIRFLL